jgi:hypothetical protein
MPECVAGCCGEVCCIQLLEGLWTFDALLSLLLFASKRKGAPGHFETPPNMGWQNHRAIDSTFRMSIIEVLQCDRTSLERTYGRRLALCVK